MNWEKPGKQASILFASRAQSTMEQLIWYNRMIYVRGDVIFCRHEWEAALADLVVYQELFNSLCENGVLWVVFTNIFSSLTVFMYHVTVDV